MRKPMKALLLVWLAWHSYVVAVNLTVHITRPWRGKRAPESVAGVLFGVPIRVRHLQALADLRHTTDWYEKRLGVHQNWPMFAPNPRMSTTWLHLIGEYADGSERVIPYGVGKPDARAPKWIYERSGKYERNATAKKRRILRRGITRDLCRDAHANHEGLKFVRFESHSVRTPLPGKATLPRDQRRTSKVQLSRFKCKKKYLEPM